MLGVRVEALRKSYGDREVVRGLTFEIAPGEIFGFLGPNGSGKSTTIRMLTTLLRPSGGDAFIGDTSIRDARAVRERIAVVFQDPSLDTRLSALENLDFYTSLYRPRWRAARRREKAMQILEQVGLADRAADLVGAYSWGMRRRLEIARSLMTDPEVLFLDEPTTGLDPQSRAGLWAHLLALREARGLTVFVATHDMEEAARCDRLGVLSEGELVATESPESLREALAASDLTEAFLGLTGRRIAAETADGPVLLKGKSSSLFRRG